ncbi:hypothetical protein SAMD00019534_072720, partial [Acytostelium subglobosum LB1]|uniref:hypothetical protein n=1 Tax=Acytostelium subglobosum LB1 TaxID=1410327 RepID=UPI000644F06E
NDMSTSSQHHQHSNNNNKKKKIVEQITSSSYSYAYVTFVNNEEYAKGVLALKQSLDDSESTYPVVVLVTDSISNSTIQAFIKLGCQVQLVTAIDPGNGIRTQIDRWMPAFTKFRAWTMTNYHRIIWLGMNIDHLFTMLDKYDVKDKDKDVIYACVDADANSCQYQPDRLRLINSGLVVLAPNNDINMRLVSDIRSVSKLQNGVLNDQDVMNYTLRWQPLQYPEYGVQVTHCQCGDARLWNYQLSHFLHFTAGMKELPKPWQYAEGHPIPIDTPSCVESLYLTWMDYYNKALERVVTG